MTGALAALAGSVGPLGGTVAVSNQSPNTVVANPGPAVAFYSLINDGTVSVNGATVESYCSPTSLAPLLEARMTVLTGSLSGSATGSWLALSSAYSWFILQNTVGSSSASGTIEIREASTGTVRTSATITFFAQVNP